MTISRWAGVAVLALAACNSHSPSQAPVANDALPSVPAPGTGPNAKTPLAPVAPKPPTPPTLIEPKGPIDPKSVEAAGQVVQHYGALVEQDRFLPAERLWNDIEAARSFAVALDAKFKDVHLEIGELGATEGAAGSIYTTVPVTFYGTSERGKQLRMPAAVILRRVNDVPGSTERQRRWHIERIEWKAVA